MADVDQEEKTEEATPRKKEQLREKGQVAKSPDVAGAATVVAVVGALWAMGEGLSRDLAALARRAFSLRDAHRPLMAFEVFGDLLFRSAVPVAAVAAVAAIGATVAQTRGLFALASLQPKPERLDPVKGLAKVLPGPQMAVETGKSLLKVGFVAVIVWRLVDTELPRFATLPAVEAEQAAAQVGAIAGRLVLSGMAGLVVLAGLDYVIAWRRFQKQEIGRAHV